MRCTGRPCYRPTEVRVTRWYDQPRRRLGLVCVARGVSIMKRYNYGRRVLIGTDGRVHFVHHLVWMRHASLRERRLFAKGGYSIHHRNEDFTDNHWKNLQLVASDQHEADHLRRMAQEFNGSQDHLDALQRYWNDPKLGDQRRQAAADTFRTYNKSKHHSKVVAERNRRLWRDSAYRKEMVDKLSHPSKSTRRKLSRGVSRSWRRAGEGERRVLARVINLLRLVLTTVSRRDRIMQEYERLRPSSNVSAENLVKRWRVTRLLYFAKKSAGSYTLDHDSVTSCGRKRHASK